MSSRFADGAKHFLSNLLLTDISSPEMDSLVHYSGPDRDFFFIY